jgi:hypothetical protein
MNTRDDHDDPFQLNPELHSFTSSYKMRIPPVCTCKSDYGSAGLL